MTEKLFTVYGKEIVQDDECWALAYSEYNANVIATALNKLNNENKSFKEEIEQLKKCYENVLNEIDILAEVNDKIYKENEELKEQLKDYIKKAKEEIRKQAENDAIRWANIGR